MIVTNKHNISLEMAVWLLFNEYDYIPDQNYISATGLMKPIRHIVLPSRIPDDQKVVPDVEDYIASAMGSALHAGIEKAWLDPVHVPQALRKLDYPEDLIQRLVVNPTTEQLAAKSDAIPVYVEQRTIRELEVNGTVFKIGGKFDMVCDGHLTDTKSGSVWKWIYGNGDGDYKLQGSIYRWLNPDKIKEDTIRINFIFTDWNAFDAEQKKDKGYPALRVMHKLVTLMSLAETEAWIKSKLISIMANQKKTENLLPECTPEELWMSEPKYKYYSDPVKATQGGRSTKNFEILSEAQAFQQEKGKGAIITVPGTPKRCDYCSAFPVCTQKDRYFGPDSDFYKRQQ
jgi:hypothetical protein